MAKLKGPLFSLAASGTVGKALTFRATRSGAIAAAPGRPTGTPTAAQLRKRAYMVRAALAWKAATTTTRSQWEALGLATNRSAWLQFSIEYILQDIQHPDEPMIPAAPWTN